MKKVSAAKYVEGVESIYVENPKYELGHDGSDGYCDCIGMCRGGLERAGATDVKNMRGTNQAARKTILYLSKIESSAQLCVGDVVLKVRDKDDPDYPLPDKYRKGGAEYTGDETNFTHIGTVTHVNPLEITHMTSPTAQKDTKLGKWSYFGELPWVEYESAPEPDPEPEPDPQTAIVTAENGKAVKMRAKPSSSCRLYWEVPVGAEVIVDSVGDDWSLINYQNKVGYMMTKFLRFDFGLCTVIIPDLTDEQAKLIIAQFPGAYLSKG